MTVQAAIYARRSPRPTESEQIERQLADSRALAADLGWKVVGEYVDNDLSAYSEKRRPAYRQLLADVAAGKISGILANHTTRLYRHPKDLVEFIELVQRTKCEVRTVTSGHYDLASAAGRKAAYQAGIDANYESDLLGERVARERRSRAAAGRPTAGGVRPFGYEVDKVTIVPKEARLIAAAAERVAAGGSMWAEAILWNEAGVTTSAGNPWEVTAVRRVLTSARIAGIRTYKGQEMGDAVWPAIIPRETHDRILAMTSGRTRPPPRASHWLLSALIPCPRCDRPLYGSTRGNYRAYACAPSPGTDRACGRASVSAEACERKVTGLMDGWLADPPAEMALWLRGDPALPDPSAEVAAIREQRQALTNRFAAGVIDGAELDGALEVLARRLAELDALPSPTVRADVTDLRTLWHSPAAEQRQRRAIVAQFVTLTLSTERMADPADRLTVRHVWP